MSKFLIPLKCIHEEIKDLRNNETQVQIYNCFKQKTSSAAT